MLILLFRHIVSLLVFISLLFCFPCKGEANSHTRGLKKVLWVRCSPTDDLASPATEAEINLAISETSDFFMKNSYNQTSLEVTITPNLTLPHIKEYYKDNSSQLMIDCRKLAVDNGYTLDDFDRFICNSSAYYGGGLGEVGGTRTWYNNNADNTAFVSHELGHNFGFKHYRTWRHSDLKFYQEGFSEDGNHYEGGETSAQRQWSPFFKRQADWVTTREMRKIKTSGVYKIYSLQSNKLGFLVSPTIEFPNEFELSFFYRSENQPYEKWHINGLICDSFDDNDKEVTMLDFTPLTKDGYDQALTVGRTWINNRYGFCVTPIRRVDATEQEPAYIETYFQFGIDPNNHAPSASFSSVSKTTPSINESVTFAVSATDVDDDQLTYHWEIDNAQVHNTADNTRHEKDKRYHFTNSSTMSLSWSKEGVYLVQCIISDMKGKTETISQKIIVGNIADTPLISGTILDYDDSPVDSARVYLRKEFFSVPEAVIYQDFAKSQSGFVASYYNNVRYRYTDVMDWRTIKEADLTQNESQINHKSNWPSGYDYDFAVQWDGYIELTERTRLSIQSDNSSRVFIDTNNDGNFDLYFGNAWGKYHELSLGTISSELSAGTYKIRVQYENTNRSAQVQLLWDNTFASGEIVSKFLYGPFYTSKGGEFKAKAPSRELLYSSTDNKSLLHPIPSFYLSNDSDSNRGLRGTYYDSNLRSIDEPDWLATQTSSYSRTDSMVFFPSENQNLWGESLTLIQKSTWDYFSCQWDGYITVPTGYSAALYLHSDDSSRLFIDINSDGDFDDLHESLNNNWGKPQAKTLSSSSTRLPSGRYKVRLQYEEGNGENVMELLWDLLENIDGLGKMEVVPVKNAFYFPKMAAVELDPIVNYSFKAEPAFQFYSSFSGNSSGASLPSARLRIGERATSIITVDSGSKIESMSYGGSTLNVINDTYYRLDLNSSQPGFKTLSVTQQNKGLDENLLSNPSFNHGELIGWSSVYAETEASTGITRLGDNNPYLFGGGIEIYNVTSTSSASQIVDISRLFSSDDVNNGNLNVAFGGWLGAYKENAPELDSVLLRVSAIDSSGQIITSFSSLEFNASAGDLYKSLWSYVTYSNEIPPGTQQLIFEVFMNKRHSSHLNAYADDLYLVIRKNRHVTFNIGQHGIHSGGGDLSQKVSLGSAATAPTIRANAGYIFMGWDVDFSNVTSDITVTAQYREDNFRAFPRYRVYNPNDGHHHWMTSEVEYNFLVNVGWTGEGFDHKVLLEEATVGDITSRPYYRLYNPNSGEHHWSLAQNEYDFLGNIGWVQEGTDGYIFETQATGTIALYRLYNPNNGFHHYTTSENENNHLGALGWDQEGVSGFVFPAD